VEALNEALERANLANMFQVTPSSKGVHDELGNETVHRCIIVMLAAAARRLPQGDHRLKDEANARIVRLHQRRVQVRVLDEQGDPAAGVSVRLRQIRQAFPFDRPERTLRGERYAEFFKTHQLGRVRK
jgi:hypothetical protein